MRAGPFLWSQFFHLKNESDQVAFPYPEQLLTVAQPGGPLCPGDAGRSLPPPSAWRKAQNGKGAEVPLFS